VAFDRKVYLNVTDEGTLRRSLFDHTGGMYPELITRGDIKLFLPPIGRKVCILNMSYILTVLGGLTVYCFGDPAKMSDEKVRLALRVHDEVSTPLIHPFMDIDAGSSTDFGVSVTEVTCSDLTSAHVVHTSSTGSRRRLRKPRGNAS
jgi:hypothetical protein